LCGTMAGPSGASSVAPATSNSMQSGPPGTVSQAWIEQSKGAVGGKIEPVGGKIEVVAPKMGELMGGNRAGMGAGVLALLNKSVEEKRNTIANVGEAKTAPGPTFERAASSVGFGRTPSLRAAVKRAQEVEKDKAEKARVKTQSTRIRISIKYIKHLPKMDTFGKTDAYCITVLDNKKSGGQKYKRKSKIVKKNLNPEFKNEAYEFEVKNYPEQEVVVTVWDWDAGDDDDIIGDVNIPLAPLLEHKLHEHSYSILGQDGKPITGHDGSSTIIKIILEKDVAPAAVGPEGINVDSLVGDPEEIRTLVTPNWEHAARGLMFDIENHSKFPVVITSFDAQAGRGKGPDASAAYRYACVCTPVVVRVHPEVSPAVECKFSAFECECICLCFGSAVLSSIHAVP